MIVLPMAAYYRREPELEARRATFYKNLHMAIGLDGWKTTAAPVSDGPQLGFDGMPPQIRKPDRNSVISVNIASAPFEWLVATGRLVNGLDSGEAQLARAEAGKAFRSAVEGAQLSSLRSANLDAVGGRSSGSLNISDHKADCIKRCARFQHRTGKERFDFLARVLVADDFSAIRTPDGKPSPKAIKLLQFCLDMIAVDIGMITTRAFVKRWSRMPRDESSRPQQGERHSGQSAAIPRHTRASTA